MTSPLPNDTGRRSDAQGAAGRSPRRRHSRSRRRFLHHASLAFGTSIGLLLMFAVLEDHGSNYKWSMATAYVSFALWIGTLAIGPLNLLRHRPNPVSTDLRRDIGIWAAAMALAHVFFGLQVHMAGRWLLYFLQDHDGSLSRVRLDAFGVGNYAGLFAGILLLLLLGLSNDLSLRRLGRHSWKRLQQSSYVAFGAVILHGVIYQFGEKRTSGFVLLFAAMCAAALGVQLLGMRERRAERRRRSAAAS